MLTNYSIGVPGYPVQGMTLQTGVPMLAQQPAIVTQPAPSTNANSNSSDLLEFSQMIADTKVGMSRIDMKIDEVLKKVDSIKEAPSNAVVPIAKPDTSIIDPNIVLSSINKVVEESRTLKQELLDRDTRIESLNQKVRQLIESNQRYVEQSQHMMEQRSDSLHSLSSANSSQIIRLQEENTSLKAKAEEAKRRLESRNLEFGESENDVSEMKKRNELLTQKMNLARTKFREKEGEIDELKGEIEKLQRETGRLKSSRESSQREANDLRETIEGLKKNIRVEKQSKKKVQINVSRLEEELGEVKAERDVINSSIEDRRRKQQNDRNKLVREIEELKRSHEEEISLLKSQMQQSTGPSQVEVTKIEANWKRKMQVEIAKNVSSFEEKIEELQMSEERLKLQVQRLERKVTNLSLENSHLQQENNRILEDLDEFENVKIRAANSQGLIEKQNSMIEELTRSENELTISVRELQESEKGLMGEVQQLGDRNRELENRDEPDGDEWRNQVKHVMNKFYASIQVEFPLQNTFTGGQVQELVKAAIKVETVRVLNPDLDSTTSATPSEDSVEVIPDTSEIHASSNLTSQELTTDSPREDSPMIDSPTLQTNSPISHSPTLQTNSPISHSPTLQTQSPIFPSETTEISTNSPILPTETTEISTNSPILPTQTTEISTNSPILPTETPEVSTKPTLEIADLFINTQKFVSLEDEDRVETSTHPISLNSTDNASFNTVVPQHATLDSSPTSSQSLTFGTPNQSPTNFTQSPTNFTQSPTNFTQSPTNFAQSPTNFIHPPTDKSPPTSPLDLSPSTSLIPFNSDTTTFERPPSTPPLLQHSPPPHTDIPAQPDISDTIQIYSTSPEKVKTQNSPPIQVSYSPPPDTTRYTSFPSHPSTPPPMDLDAPEAAELPTTGNFSPDLLEKHFSAGDNAIPLDESLPTRDEQSEELVCDSPVTKVDVENPLSNSPIAIEEVVGKTEKNISNSLLGGSSDSESEIFGVSKKKQSEEDEKSVPIPSTRPTPPKNSLFGDSDDDLDWLS